MYICESCVPFIYDHLCSPLHNKWGIHEKRLSRHSLQLTRLFCDVLRSLDHKTFVLLHMGIHSLAAKMEGRTFLAYFFILLLSSPTRESVEQFTDIIIFLLETGCFSERVPDAQGNLENWIAEKMIFLVQQLPSVHHDHFSFKKSTQQ